MLNLKFTIGCKYTLVFFVAHNSTLLIFPYSLLKEVGLSFKRDVLHEIKRVCYIVNLKDITI